MPEQRVSFKTQGDFQVTVGSPAVDVAIPRLKFKDADKVIGIISNASSLSATAALKVIFATKNAGPDATKFDDIAKSVESILPELMRLQSFGIIKDLFDRLTYDAIVPDVVETMDYQEMCDLIAYLVRGSFGALKNLQASFEAITMSQSNENRS